MIRNSYTKIPARGTFPGTLILLYLLALPGMLASQDISLIRSSLSDPRIPAGEESRYRTVSDDETSYFRIVVEHGNSASGPLYHMRQFGEDSDRILSLTQAGLIPLEASEISRVNGSRYSSGTRLESAPAVGSDEIFVFGFEDLSLVLRGYPFSSPRDLRLHTLGQDGQESEFSVTVRYDKREEIEIAGREYEAHKLELVFRLPGALSIFRGFIPKTYLWYSTEAPHLLLRYEGGSFGPGRGNQVTELVEHRVISAGN